MKRGEMMKEKVMVDKETLRKVIALLIAEETGVAGELNQEDYDFNEDVDVILTLARGLYLTPESRTEIIELAEDLEDEMEDIASQNQRH